MKTEEREWQNGEWLVFMDAYNHEAWNNTSKERYIFLMDVIRDEHYTERYKIGATVLSSLFLQKRFGKYALNLVKHPFLVKTMTTLAIPFARFSVYMANRLKWF